MTQRISFCLALFMMAAMACSKNGSTPDATGGASKPSAVSLTYRVGSRVEQHSVFRPVDSAGFDFAVEVVDTLFGFSNGSYDEMYKYRLLAKIDAASGSIMKFVSTPISSKRVWNSSPPMVDIFSLSVNNYSAIVDRTQLGTYSSDNVLTLKVFDDIAQTHSISSFAFKYNLYPHPLGYVMNMASPESDYFYTVPPDTIHQLINSEGRAFAMADRYYDYYYTNSWYQRQRVDKTDYLTRGGGLPVSMLMENGHFESVPTGPFESKIVLVPGLRRKAGFAYDSDTTAIKSVLGMIFPQRLDPLLYYIFACRQSAVLHVEPTDLKVWYDWMASTVTDSTFAVNGNSATLKQVGVIRNTKVHDSKGRITRMTQVSSTWPETKVMEISY